MRGRAQPGTRGAACESSLGVQRSRRTSTGENTPAGTRYHTIPSYETTQAAEAASNTPVPGVGVAEPAGKRTSIISNNRRRNPNNRIAAHITISARLSSLLAVFAFFFCPAIAQAIPPARTSVRADSIGFYFDRMMLAAQGRVRARLGTRKIECDALRYDLAHNTVTAVGNVRVISQRGDFSGAAYALNLVTGAATLLKLDPLPSTFTLRDDDVSTAVEAPAEPDAFNIPDTGAELPYITSMRADVVSNASVRFTPARFPVNAKIAVPSPSYMYVFAPNPAFGVTPPTLPAASFDQPYDLIGTTHSLLAAHLRYSTTNGIGTSIDEHLVDGPQRYLVGSYMLQDRHFDVDGFEQLSPHLTQNVTGSLAENEKYASYVLQRTSKLITTTLTLTQSEQSLGPLESASSAVDDLQVNTVVRRIGHLLSYKLRTDYGYDNNLPQAPSPTATLAPSPTQSQVPSPIASQPAYQVPYNADFRTTVGASLYTPAVSGPFKTSLSGEYDFSSTHYDYPHQLAYSTTLFTLSRRINHAVSLYGNVSFAQTYDHYNLQAFPNAPQQFWGLPSPGSSFIAPDGTPYPGYLAFNGVSTTRTYFLTTTIAPNPNFNLLVSLTEMTGFPQFHGEGPTPLTASFDLRIRPIRNYVAVEFGRSYVFGWDGQHLTPQYTLGISP